MTTKSGSSYTEYLADDMDDPPAAALAMKSPSSLTTPCTQSVFMPCVVSAATRAPKKASHVSLLDQCVETCNQERNQGDQQEAIKAIKAIR